jgi:ADP-ribose pyrophosphatase YjhB (NUDIX family)
MKDTYCSHCGAAYPPPLHYPRRCANPTCGVEIWANPIPVAVVLLPVQHERERGILVIRRAIEPRRGHLALAGGFAEEHETWQQAGTRELREETGISIDPAQLEPFWFTSTEPKPNRVLLFAVASAVASSELAHFVPNHEVSERGLIFGPDGLSDIFAFPLHQRAVERYFRSVGANGPHGFKAL